MRIHYTGRQVELSEAQKQKLEPKFQKVHKILGQRHDPEVHVILSLERHLYIAEVTLHFQHHTMVVECSGSDLFTAAVDAADKLEKQIIRNKDKWRERKRRSKPPWQAPAEPEREDGTRTARGTARSRRAQGAAAPRIFRATPAAKPLTIEEAILEMEEDDRDCVVYQDADKGRLSVLFRRRDGHLQLVEA